MLNDRRQVFDSTLELIVSQSAVAAAYPKYSPDSRSLFYYLLHVSEHEGVLPIAHAYLQQALAKLPTEDSSTAVQFCNESVDSDIVNRVQALLPQILETPRLLQQLAPVVMTTPFWLHKMAQPASSDEPLAVALFSTYLACLDEQSGKLQWSQQYRRHLLSLDLALPEIDTWAFSRQTAINPLMFEFGTVQLALSSMPRLYFPEILGFTLACFQMLAEIGQYGLKPIEIIPETIAELHRLIAEYRNRQDSDKPGLGSRIRQGHRLYCFYLAQGLVVLEALQQRPETNERKLIALIERIGAKAAGHHGNISLQGKNLDAWFQQKPFAGKAFLTALKNSSYVDQAQPENSRLLKLFEFSGPMFGVLSTRDRQLLLDWLQHPESTEQLQAHTTNAMPAETTAALPAINTSPALNYRRMNHRRLFYYLINAELYPEVLFEARRRLRGFFSKLRYMTKLPITHYEPNQLEAWVERHYQREMAAYHPLKGEPKLSKAAYRWGIEQLAPTVLVDGCWLAGTASMQFYSTAAVGKHLFDIYSDELGAGRLRQNHPYIYRQLLQSLAIDLAPTQTLDFIEHPGFIAGAFDIPVCLLAIGQFPCEFLPETLGINLAIELSGLGRQYMRLADELDYWAIDPTIVNVHIAIDNVATGHTALATKAIQRYLDGILDSQGETAMNAHWRRIFVGYRALSWVGMRFKYSLFYNYLRHGVRYR